MHHVIKVARNTEFGFIVSTIALTICTTLLSAYFGWGYLSALLLAIGMYGAIATFTIWFNDRLLKALLLFGTTAGFTELIADAWLVNGINNLVYPAQEPRIWASPIYMPFAWAVVLFQVSYLGWLYAQNHSLPKTIGISFLIGIVFIPMFETCAKFADWWYYRSLPMFLNAPIYIIVGEGLITMVLPLIYAGEMNKSYSFFAIAGILQGLWVFMAYFLTYQVFG